MGYLCGLPTSAIPIFVIDTRVSTVRVTYNLKGLVGEREPMNFRWSRNPTSIW